MVTVLRRLRWEGWRWFSPWLLLAVTIVSIFSFVADTCSNLMFLEQLERGDLFYESIYYFLDGPAWMCNISLCLVAFVGAGLYAQDYEENAVYMRLQRMGAGRYAGLRILQVSAASWFVGCVSILLVCPLLSALFHIPLFPKDCSELTGVTTSRLLLGGRKMEFLAALGILSGFRSMFYALVTFAISFVLPKKKVLVAIPILLWYFNQYVLVWLDWISAWLQPRNIFELHYGMLDASTLGLGKISEWNVLLRIAVGMLCLSGIIWAVFVWHLHRAGTFGGEQSE